MHEVNTPFCKGADSNNWMKWSRMCALLQNKELAWWTLLNGFNAIFEECRPEVSCPTNFLCGRHSREKTTTSSKVVVIQNALSLVMGETSVEDCIGAATIKGIIHNQIVFHMMANAATILTG